MSLTIPIWVFQVAGVIIALTVIYVWWCIKNDWGQR